MKNNQTQGNNSSEKNNIKNILKTSTNKIKKDDDKNDQTNKIYNDVILGNFVCLKKIGEGSFGKIYLSFNKRDDIEVAIKKEEKKNNLKEGQLSVEAQVYKTLFELPDGSNISGNSPLIYNEVKGVPLFYGYGQTDIEYYLIIEFLGPNLKDLLSYCGTHKFTISTVGLIAIQLLNRIEYLHKKNYVHRDIKPENILIGTQMKSNIIYLIDFGLSKKYKNQKNNQHIPYKEGRSFIGNARYASINTHLGIEQSRRDDLESIGYILVFFLKGTLPWKGSGGKSEKNYQKILEKKLQIPTEILCYNLPEEIIYYLNYCKNLRFEDKPDYDYFRGLFIKMLCNCNLIYGLTKDMLKFDWCFENPQKTIWSVYNKKKLEDYKSSFMSPSKSNINQKLTKDNVKDILNKKTKNEEEVIINIIEKENEKNNSDSNTESNKNQSDSNSIKKEDSKVEDNNISKENKLRSNQKSNYMDNSSNISNDNEDNMSKTDDSEKTEEHDFVINKNDIDFILENNNENIEPIDSYIVKLLENYNKDSQINNISSIKEVNIKLYNSQRESKKHSDNNISFEVIKKDNPRKNTGTLGKSNKDLNLKVSFKLDSLLSDMKVSKESMIKIRKDPINKYYTVIKDLGRGSYGQVKKVRNIQLNEERAMKIVNKKSESSINEVEILRKISHPNIANVFEIFEDMRKYYIMMEYLEGGELFEVIINQGFFSELDAAIIMKQLLSAVNYLHSMNIVHRDLKPENIMLSHKLNDTNYQIKLIDFGTAKIFDPNKKIKKFIGTSYYIAPEVLDKNYDYKCDIWSCGIILYILLCGYPPFNGNTNTDIFYCIKNTEPQFNDEEWNENSAEAISLIKSMIMKNPDERYNANQCLNHPWFKILEKEEKTNKIKSKNNLMLNISKFVNENRLKKAMLQFISTQFNLKEEESELRELFNELDTEKKGQITKQQFAEYLKNVWGEDESQQISNQIFESIDLDKSGKISYNEFLSVMINEKKVITEDKLLQAFKMFDKDNSGKLSIDEIKAVFGGDSEMWKKVIEEIDLNKDGEVDFKEFKQMMTKMDKQMVNETEWKYK